MLRTQTEAMSATIGAVDSLTVRPFDETFETPTEFAERIAVNRQLLLKEAHFDKVTDGFGFILHRDADGFTRRTTWKLFRRQRRKGSMKPSRPVLCRMPLQLRRKPVSMQLPTEKRYCWAPTSIQTLRKPWLRRLLIQKITHAVVAA